MTTLAATPDPHEADTELGNIGMWIFLATEVLFFGGLFVAYGFARARWPQGFAAAGAHTHLWLGTLNTGLLLTSSALVALAVACNERADQRRWAATLLGLAAAIGLAFIGVKGIEYTKEWRESLFPGPGFALGDVAGAQLFFMLYFVTTAVHALHLVIGVGTLGTFAWGTHRLAAWAPPHRVEIAGLYWHFVDIVWIVLYPLLYLMGRHA